jgi:2'-5' RNA ligase
MKIFALYTNLKLKEKPAWFDEFTEKYGAWWEPHITLCQPRHINDDEIDQLKEIANDFFSKLRILGHAIEVSFNSILPQSDKNAIMLKAENNATLMKLQRELCAMLSEYTHYVDPLTQSYEENFEPHITIARDLSEEQYREACDYLKDECSCQGIIDEIVLAIVKENTPEEANNPVNQMRYKL